MKWILFVHAASLEYIVYVIVGDLKDGFHLIALISEGILLEIHKYFQVNTSTSIGHLVRLFLVQIVLLHPTLQLCILHSCKHIIISGKILRKKRIPKGQK